MKSFCLLSLCIALIAGIHLNAATQKMRVRVNLQTTSKSFLRNHGFIADHPRSHQFIEGYINMEDLKAMPAAWRETLEILGPDLPVPRSYYQGYLDYKGLTEEFKSIAKSYPELVRLESAGKTVQGREQWYLVLSDNAAEDEPEPKILLIANQHGDEVVGREVMRNLIQYLLIEYPKNPAIAELIDNSQIFILPSMNPDGFELGQRWNARGEDLNRNFPDFVDDPNNTPEGREIETGNLMALYQRHHFLTGLNFHGGEVCLNIPWDNLPNNNPETMFGDDPFIYHVSRDYADLNPEIYANDGYNFDHGLTYGYEWYPISGGLQDFANFYAQSIVATAEISVPKWPSISAIPKYWENNRESLLSFLSQSIRGAHLYVTDEAGTELSNISISVSSAPRRKVTYAGPYIHKPTVDGTQKVQLEANGYVPENITLEAKPFQGQFEHVVLKRKP